jgi:deaminated glutathione amidase
METILKVSLIQMNTRDDKAANLRVARELIEAAVERDRPDIVSLPETWTSMTSNFDVQYGNSETIPDGEACRMMAELAQKHGIYVHGGSMAERSDGKCFNTTLVFNPSGEIIARYRKIHLFDVEVPGGVSYRESATMKAGSDVVTCDIDGTTVGLSVCYDMRFPELYRALRDQGAKVIFLPAAFTMMTGRDHWETLIKARAIETQSWLVAPAQIFEHDNGKICYGRSIVVDPWGTVVAKAPDKVGFVTADIDPAYADEVRAKMPVMQHHRLDKIAAAQPVPA